MIVKILSDDVPMTESRRLIVWQSRFHRFPLRFALVANDVLVQQTNGSLRLLQ